MRKRKLTLKKLKKIKEKLEKPPKCENYYIFSQDFKMIGELKIYV